MAEGELTVGVIKEHPPAERRVALVPETVETLRQKGVRVAVQTGAGAGTRYDDSDYTAAGALVVPEDELGGLADVLLGVHRPPAEFLRKLTGGTTVIALHGMRGDPELLRELADNQITLISLELLPRQLSRAQAMDALSSQANVAGYKAAIVAADAFDRYFPLLMTAAGVARPAQVLVLGAGVAGLQAIATARRLGAQLTAYDVRPAAREEIASLGASVLKLPGVEAAVGSGGYARALTDAERQAQQGALIEAVARFDVVITAAQTPGSRPPVLLPTAAVRKLRAGAVVVDAAAGPLGGNVEGLPATDEAVATTITDGGVTLVAAPNLPATVPRASSDAYARNMSALLGHLIDDGALRVDLDDEITGAITLTHGGEVRDPTAPNAPQTPPTEQAGQAGQAGRAPSPDDAREAL